MPFDRQRDVARRAYPITGCRQSFIWLLVANWVKPTAPRTVTLLGKVGVIAAANGVNPTPHRSYGYLCLMLHIARIPHDGETICRVSVHKNR